MFQTLVGFATGFGELNKTAIVGHSKADRNTPHVVSG